MKTEFVFYCGYKFEVIKNKSGKILKYIYKGYFNP